MRNLEPWGGHECAVNRAGSAFHDQTVLSSHHDRPKTWTGSPPSTASGIPTVGFTWCSLTDQVDWDVGLREQNNRVHPVGLYDLNREIRPVGLSYKQLIQDWREVLPTQSICLTAPVAPPGEYGEPVAERRRSDARHLRDAELSGETG
ncbi:hypothetical protein [Phenylobacterium sp.]|uniref:hypothetical protein n=1 Tax=Phenylobacterium sp. TaxID=1871053 RepID=UPI00391CA2CF